MNRYGKRIMSFICAFVIVAGSVCSFSFTSQATDYSFTTSFLEPTADEYSGYMLLNINGSLYVYVWKIVPEDANNTTEMSVTVTDRTLISFTASCSNSGKAYLSMWSLNPSGNESCILTTSFTNSLTKNVGGTNTIYGYSFRGNYSYVNAVTHPSVNVVWGDQEPLYVTLQAILDALNGSSDSEMLSEIENILSCIDNLEDGILQIQELLTTKLQEIYDELLSFETMTEEKLNNIYARLHTIHSAIEIMSDKLDVTNEWLHDIYIELGNLLSAVQINGDLEREWFSRIYALLLEFKNAEASEDLPVPDEEDKLGQLEDAEAELLPDTSEAEGSLSLTINNAFSFLTYLIDKFVKVDSRVFSFYLTMLSLGVMALVMGR